MQLCQAVNRIVNFLLQGYCILFANDPSSGLFHHGVPAKRQARSRVKAKRPYYKSFNWMETNYVDVDAVDWRRISWKSGHSHRFGRGLVHLEVSLLGVQHFNRPIGEG
jgi:hypothetical protein